ncbi:hypothetical protein [Flavobacterium sp. GT3R68]|uniref:hypothetical protein n=1 Tax=Flavobacterium sp. GT3R68 TaxID=2594437 RepID=UPI000F87AC2F|nr:hypothetical protein [Flavobacterium sp. GT3R68]RTY90249.1 hypothetical protein EKL32_21510 [Flavobacterium sp. GSN2]TRW90550.1 hypothetical protein FNW07_11015 [Flavobacterium sp. GT3R68]
MKKIIVAALLIVGMTGFAQEKRKMHSDKAGIEQMTPEQRSQLHLKKLTLDLDLNASQQKEMSKLLAEQSAKREAAMAERKATKDASKKMTSDERFARKNRMLDEQIAMKERVRKILTPEQMKKWEEMKEHKAGSMRKRMMRNKMKAPKPE